MTSCNQLLDEKKEEKRLSVIIIIKRHEKGKRKRKISKNTEGVKVVALLYKPWGNYHQRRGFLAYGSFRAYLTFPDRFWFLQDYFFQS